MTEKLFYKDSHLAEFTATVQSCEQEEKYYKVVLDRTAFFSEGGGQSADTGILDGVKVFDVQEAPENRKDGRRENRLGREILKNAAALGRAYCVRSYSSKIRV